MRSDAPVLVIVPNWLGDVVMSLPALAALREQGPLVALGAKPVLSLLTDACLVDATVTYDRKGADRGLRGLWKASRAGRAHRPAKVVALPPSLRAASLAALVGAPRRVGFGPVAVRGLLNGRRPVPPRSIHLADAWWALARDAALPTASAAMPRLTPGERGRAAWSALRRHRGLDGPFFVLAPGATYGPTKRWPEESFVRLAHEVSARGLGTPVVVGGGDAAEQELCAHIAQAGGGRSIAGETDLPTLAAVLQDASAFVGNDSGPMHLAAAVGTATVGIFGSTSPAWTGPRGSRAVACGPHPVECSPCFRRRCPIGLPCLVKLSCDNVLGALDRLLHEA